MDYKRIIAFLIDIVICAFIQAVLMMIFIIRPALGAQASINDIFVVNILITYLSLTYLVFRDLFLGRSIGKRIMSFKIVNIDTGKNISIIKLLLRNITWYLGPVEIIYFFIYKKRIGDKIAKSDVIRIK